MPLHFEFLRWVSGLLGLLDGSPRQTFVVVVINLAAELHSAAFLWDCVGSGALLALGLRPVGSCGIARLVTLRLHESHDALGDDEASPSNVDTLQLA
jgi:hypothetical protein